jgi:catechol 2,3-dioxygenase-like lactoylglutathione lyase family enzyme
MLQALNHIAMTVKSLDASIRYYQQLFGFEVRSDEERKGEWVDKVTGIPGFHTRTVYLSVSPQQDFELYEFYNPKTLPAEIDRKPRVGVSYIVLQGKLQGTPSASVASDKNRSSKGILRACESSSAEMEGVAPLQDLDGLNVLVEQGKVEEGSGGVTETRILYPAVIVKDIKTSASYYQEVLGFELAGQGGPCYDPILGAQDGVDTKNRWALLRTGAGAELKLIQPQDREVLAPRAWRMERIGLTHVAFAVLDIEKCYSDLLKKGVPFKSPPQQVAVGPHKEGKVVYFPTPEGVMVELIESPLTRLQLGVQ